METVKSKFKKKNKIAKVHPELEGLDIKINTFGQLALNIDIDAINEFLDKHVEDKKIND